jgi:protein SCO1
MKSHAPSLKFPTCYSSLVLTALAVLASPCLGQLQSQSILQDVGFDQKLNMELPLDATFRDETGRSVALGDYFGKRPVILTLVYYECPMLCTQELSGLVRSLKTLSYTPGNEFEIVTVSISPTETPALAAKKKDRYLRSYDHPGAERGWHFLTGDESSIRRLAQATGFRYTYNPKTKLYAHAAGLAIATPMGRIARYFYGISYPARDLKLGLVEAGSGKIGSPIDKILLLCYAFDPSTGRYTFAIMSTIRVLGVATFGSLATFILFMVRRDQRRANAPAAASNP